GIRDFHVTGVQTCALPASASPTGTDTTLRSPRNTIAGENSDFSAKNASGRIDGDTEGRPDAPVVPGDHEVPAGAISRAKHSRASRRGWRTAMRSTASRATRSAGFACGP